MTSIEKHLVKVFCDKCGWNSEEYVPDWHNKECPDCGYSPIVSDKDLDVWKGIELLHKAGAVAFVEDKTEGEFMKIQINTSGLRN